MFQTRQLTTAESIFNLNKLLAYIGKVHDNDFDNNLNGMTLSELWTKYEPEINQQTQNSKTTLAGQKYEKKSDYQVVRIATFGEANKYSNYVSWCVTQGKSSYSSYTNNGIRVFYFLLKNGYQNIKKEIGSNTPKDEYGLSMIAVSVGEDGSMTSSTCRWNHENGGNDNLFTVDEISKLLGRNFYDVCKPYTKEDRERDDKAKFANIQKQLDSGVELSDIFDRVDDFNDGYATVQINDKYDWINTNRELVSPNQWFDSVGYFSDGYARVKIDNKCNWINTNAEYLSPNQWFDSVGDFRNGYALVKINGKYNFINTNGELVSPNQWFDYIENFNNGYFQVQINGKYNLINTNGELVSPNQWFDSVEYFNDGYAKVELNDKYNLINANGELVSPNQWFDSVEYFNDGYARVRLNGNRNLVNANNGELVSPNQWFDYIWDFRDGYAIVEINDKYNWINTNGEYLSPNQWFDSVEYFNDGYATVQINGKGYTLDTEGNLTPR